MNNSSPILLCALAIGCGGATPAERPRADRLTETSAQAKAALASEDSDVGDTAIDCGTPFDADTASPDSGGAGGHDHNSPENKPYDIDAFDDVKNCASCHPDHYDDWYGSIHAYAASSPVFWKGSAHIGETTEFPLSCIGCHATIATLSASLPPATPITAKEQLPAAAQHGVSCTVCHKLYDVHDGVNQLTQCDDYYFGTLEDPQDNTYHSNDYSGIHTEALVCRSCHNVENLNGVQVELTYSEWLEENENQGGTEFEPAIQTCQDCHMPAYEGTAALGGPTRTVHRHTFVGGDVALTPFPDSHRQYKLVEDLMRTAGTLDIIPAYDGEGGTFSDVDLRVTNLIEGHNLPTGAAFDRQVWLELYVTDADGNVMLESGTLDGNGDLMNEHSELAPSADFWITNRLSIFRSYLTDVNGDETFDFIGAATKIEDASLLPGETRYVRYHLGEAPTTATPLPITIEARLLYRPFPPFLLRNTYEMDDDLIASVPIFEIATATAVLEGVTE